MLKFFRKIRQNLIAENSFFKYMLYAVGEILLVIIGILIALQINNWNENRKQSEQEKVALIDLKEEFKNNKAIFLKHHDRKRESEQNWHQFLLRLKNKESPFKNEVITRPSAGSNTLNLTFGSLNTILSTGKIDRIKNDSLKSLLTSWNDFMEEYTEDEKMHWEFNRNIFQTYEVGIITIPWLGELSKGNGFQFIFREEEERLKNWEKILKDIKYQNLMIIQHNYLVNNQLEGEQLRQKFNQVIALLDSELTNN